MATMHTLPAVPPMPAVARILSRYDRDALSSFIAVAIDLLDTLDGDPDAEEAPLEDAFVQHDPEFAYTSADTEAGAYAEWSSLTPAQRRQGGCLIHPGGHEDDELDGDETDGNGAEDEPCAWFKGQWIAAGCPVSDPGGCQYD